MSTDPHVSAHSVDGLPEHSDVSFESRDVKATTIYWYLFSLGISVVLSLFLCVYIYRFLTDMAASSDTPPIPARQQMLERMTPAQRDAMLYPPEPRLQGVPGHQEDPQQDLRTKIRQDMEANEQLGWIDKNAGIAQIPVKDAMKIIAEKGLPGASAPAEKK